MSDDDNMSVRRSRRQKPDNRVKRAALEQFKDMKACGKKFKLDIQEVDNVYDNVTEEEYSEIVSARQSDGFVVDGDYDYAREIFDDDLVDDSAQNTSKSRNVSKPGKQRQKVVKSNLESYFKKMTANPSKDVSVEGDEELADILSTMKHNRKSVEKRPIKIKQKTKIKSGNPETNPFTVAKISNAKVEKNAPGDTKTEPNHKDSKTEPVSAAEQVPRNSKDSSLGVNKKEEPRSATIKSECVNVKDELASLQEELCMNELEEEMQLDDFAADPVDNIKEEEVKINETWDTLKGPNWEGEFPETDNVDCSNVPLETLADGSSVLKFYWIDAYEDYHKKNGTVYLFGKVWMESVNKHVSCCVAVNNIERQLYVLPRSRKYDNNSREEDGDPVTMKDVYHEFNELASKHKITSFKSKQTCKKYAFEIVDVPTSSDYLEVRYSTELPQIPSNVSGVCIKRIFGTQTSCLESFLLNRQIKGPYWLEIKHPKLPESSTSWCQLEVNVSHPNCVSVGRTSQPPPMMTVLTLAIKTVLNIKLKKNQVVAIAGLVHHKYPLNKRPPEPPFQYYFCGITSPRDCIFPHDFREYIRQQDRNVDVMTNERALLSYFLGKIQKIDPDVIVSHDIVGFTLDILLQQLSSNKIPTWSRLGRLKKSIIPKTYHSACSGRLLCDVMLSAKELIRCKSYDLTELSNHLLRQKRIEMDNDKVTDSFLDSKSLLKLIEHTWIDAFYTLKIACDLNILPLALQITNIAGNVMSRTLLSGRSERNEFLLLHAFTEQEYICPDKQERGKFSKFQALEDGAGEVDDKKRKKAGYVGGLVLEPQRGFYDKYILLLDFNSLYPSIIQEYNICFTTIDWRESGDEIPDVPGVDSEKGILPSELKKLVERRQVVKRLIKDPKITKDEYMQYDIRQRALKLTANSMYGCLGFSHSRFYAKPLAALVTCKGREILQKTKELVESSMNLEVIYGDTDSIMVNTNTTDFETVFKLGNKVKADVNKKYKLIELDIDGIYKYMLLLRKKKYAALALHRAPDGTIYTQQELKGLDVVRRDWCGLAKQCGIYVIDQILSDHPKKNMFEKINDKLHEVAKGVRENTLEIGDYCINKQLTKNPADYPDKKALPHVQVALRLNANSGKRFHQGDTISYIICDDGSKNSATQRAYHAVELLKREDLKIDVHYYLSSQVHPVVSRITEPIAGLSSAFVADMLGLDPAAYKQSKAVAKTYEDDDEVIELNPEERYRNAEPFPLTCPQCGSVNQISDHYRIVNENIGVPELSQCTNHTCQWVPHNSPAFILNSLTNSCRNHVSKYYLNWMTCDGADRHKMRRVPGTFPNCCWCSGVLLADYSAANLHTQLSFYSYLFEESAMVNKAKKDKVTLQKEDACMQLLRQLHSLANSVMATDLYNQVYLTPLFSFIKPKSCLHAKEKSWADHVEE